MPNHVTTRCLVAGSVKDITAFKELMFVPDNEGAIAFDFQRIIPMPKILDNTQSSSTTDDGMCALGHEKTLEYDFQKPVLHYPRWASIGIDTPEKLKAWLEKNNPAALEAAQHCIAAFKETGYADWYDWKTANWGTKWGSYAFNLIREDVKSLLGEDVEGLVEFTFDTAWGYPRPIFQALSRKFLGLRFVCHSHDEGGNFAVKAKYHGVFNLIQEETFEDEQDLRRIYYAVYGSMPEFEEDQPC